MSKHFQTNKHLLVLLFALFMGVLGNANLFAQNITFADANVKDLCVANWDTNGDGELSYMEAAAVTTLNNVFSFNEPEFGDGIGSIDGLAEYLGEWDGDFTTLKPGQGYFYWNESGETKTFVFQTGAKAKARIANPVVKKPKTDTDKTKND